MSTKNTGMYFERDEVIGVTVSIVVAVLFFTALRFDLYHRVFTQATETEKQTVPEVVAIDSGDSMQSLMRALGDAITNKGAITKLIVEDSKVGEGAEVKSGSRVTVNYVGMLQDGTQFDNSYSRGTPFSFTVGGGTVIKGWDTGILGMKEGGERILVIPPEMAYGDRVVGPVPANATLLFAVELISVE